VAEPVYYGPDATVAYDLVCSLKSTQDQLAGLGPTAAEVARGRLRAMLAARETDRGVFFDSRAWIVTARRGSAN
jgi:hypothetical protein